MLNKKRSQAESTLAYIQKTNYQHNDVANYIMSAASVVCAPESLAPISEHLSFLINGFRAIDFIRCIEIRYTRDKITFILKRLKYESTAVLKDRDIDHEELARVCISCVNPVTGLRATTRHLLEMFIKTSLKGRAAQLEPEDLVWYYRDRRPSVSGPDDKVVSFRHVLDMFDVLYASRDFRCIITQNTILFQNLKHRIWVELP